MTRLQVELDPAVCVCSLACVEAVPQVFASEGYAVKVVDSTPSADLREELEEAEEMCPTGAIRLHVLEDEANA